MLKLTEKQLEIAIDPLIKKGVLKSLKEYKDILKEQHKIYESNDDGAIRIYESPKEKEEIPTPGFSRPTALMLFLKVKIKKYQEGVISDNDITYKEKCVIDFLDFYNSLTNYKKNVFLNKFKFDDEFRNSNVSCPWVSSTFNLRITDVYKRISNNELPVTFYEDGLSKMRIVKVGDAIDLFYKDLDPEYKEKLIIYYTYKREKRFIKKYLNQFVLKADEDKDM